jgi:O-succinylbenzoic acid--CoA ligase
VNPVWINGHLYSPDLILSGTWSSWETGTFEKKVLKFIRDWETGKELFEFRTSGTTGTPKILPISRDKMLLSAGSTLQFLDLQEGKCLLCLDPGFIAGAMLIVRALVGGMDLLAVDPVSDPLKTIPSGISIALCAMVPMQLIEILNDSNSRKKFEKIHNVLIGGADLSKELISRMSGFSNHIFHTFGMTETVTHIALKKLTGIEPDEPYRAVSGVVFSTDERGCLVITGPITDNMPMVTNDRVDLIDSKSFRWLGRIDHVINSGGIKIQLEILEKKMVNIFREAGIKTPFFLTGLPDEKLGEKLTIVFETGGKSINKKNLREIIEEKLPFHEVPRAWYSLPELIRTTTGKIDRIGSLRSAYPIP